MKPDKQKAITKFEQLKNTAETLRSKPRFCPEFAKWEQDLEVAIKKVFGSNSEYLEKFNKMYFYASNGLLRGSTKTKIVENQAYQDYFEYVIAMLSSFIDELNDWDDEQSQFVQASPIDNIKLIINKFHQVVKQLTVRHTDRNTPRNTLKIDDEYDVQDLLHSLLKLYFDDIRAEEPVPSHAGAASRVDFLLKKEQIFIEVKKTRPNLTDKEIGKQLSLDSQSYPKHPDCKHLICFVYDPDQLIKNPRGIEDDLTKNLITGMNGIPVSVFIVQY